MKNLRNLSTRAKAVAVIAALAVIAIPTAVYLLSGPSHPVEGVVCELKSNEEYRSVMDERLAPYEYDTLLAEFDNPSAVDAANHAEDIGNRSYITIFTMRSCTYTDRLHVIQRSLDKVVNELPNQSGIGYRAAPADLEAGWFEDLGVDGLLTGWAMVSLVGSEQAFWDTDLTAETASEDAEKIQALFSHGLANATNPDRETLIAENNYTPFNLNADFYLSEDYIDRFIELGGSEVTLAKYEGLRWIEGPGASASDIYRPDSGAWKPEAVGPTVHGWSVLAPLLRFGHFHEDFLVPVATAIVEFDRAKGGDWTVDGEGPVSFDLFSEDPSNAMNAVFEALSRNSAAAEVVYAATGDERIAPFTDGD